MDSRKQKFINEAKTQLKRLSEVERVLDGDSNKRHIDVYSLTLTINLYFEGWVCKKYLSTYCRL
jgi:hypothetical protein